MAEPQGFWVSRRSRKTFLPHIKGAITAVRMDPNDNLTTIGLFLPCCRWRRADESGIGCDIDRTDDSRRERRGRCLWHRLLGPSRNGTLGTGWCSHLIAQETSSGFLVATLAVLFTLFGLLSSLLAPL